jgi:competence ComEA-like helix-hairpin-helix protein
MNYRGLLPEKRSKQAVSDKIHFSDSYAQKNSEQINRRQAFEPTRRQAWHTHEPILLNTADSASLERLPGIGPVLASRIIRYREKLGGFHQKEQLREVYGISDSLYSLLEPLVKEIPGNAQTRKIDINRISLDTLRQHPYLRWDKAKAIIRYREANGPFRSEKELRNIWTLDSSTLARLLPYIQFDSLIQ